MPSIRDIKRALARIRHVMPQEKKVALAHRNIRLGLGRVSRIIPEEQNWLGLHVGGTNGKGSICALLAGMFRQSGISHGLYSSPAIPEAYNGVTINGLYVNKRMHEMVLRRIQSTYIRLASGWRFSDGEDAGNLTPFELETATAFRIFDRMRVKYGIVEVGMGGATDATNAMRQKAVTVISKVGLDHQEYLGSTIEEIAKIKAGIMRPGVPCVVDHTNPDSVQQILKSHARQIGTQIHTSRKALPFLDKLDRQKFKLEEYEAQNLLCATLAFRLLFPHLEVDLNRLLASKPYLPGRNEAVSIAAFSGGMRTKPILVDGAHNMLGVEALAKLVDGRIRQRDEAVTWVMGLSASESKPFTRMIETLIRPQDKFAFVEYKRNPYDPPPAPADLGRAVGAAIVKDSSQLYDGGPNLEPALRWACTQADQGPLVVTGSLYLIRELFKLDGVEQQRKLGMRRPGRTQLWHYIRLSRKRDLSPEEAREFKRARRHWFLRPESNPTFRAVGHGDKPQPLPVSEAARDLQREVGRRKRQMDGYAVAMKNLERDLAEVPEVGAAESPGSIDRPGLCAGLEVLKRRHEEHRKAYDKAMRRLRVHAADDVGKHLTYEKLFGKPEKPRSKTASLLRELEEEEARGKQAEADVTDEISHQRRPPR